MMKIVFPTIYPLTNSGENGFSHSRQVAEFAAAGAKIIQLREKASGSRLFLEEAVKAVELAREHNAKIIINDRVDIALMSGAAGVHLGQNDLSPLDARKTLGENAVIGFSTHNLDQVNAALELPIDYIAFGPIFATSTKLDAELVVGMEILKKIKGIIGQMPLVAIGGITADNIKSVLNAGADSAAIISYFSENPLPISASFAVLKEKIGENVKNC